MGRDVVDEIAAAWRVELPELAGLPLEVAKRSARLAGLIDEVTVAELDRLGRTRAEHEVLSRLRAAGPPYRGKPNDLSSSLLLSSGGTTNVLHRLAAAGLLVREADPADRRGVWVRLTPEGVRVAERTALAANAAQAELLGRLPEELVRELADLLRAVLARLDPGGLRPLDQRPS